jgi:hypothetical protein
METSLIIGFARILSEEKIRPKNNSAEEKFNFSTTIVSANANIEKKVDIDDKSNDLLRIQSKRVYILILQPRKVF